MKWSWTTFSGTQAESPSVSEVEKVPPSNGAPAAGSDEKPRQRGGKPAWLGGTNGHGGSNGARRPAEERPAAQDPFAVEAPGAAREGWWKAGDSAKPGSDVSAEWQEPSSRGHSPVPPTWVVASPEAEATDETAPAPPLHPDLLVSLDPRFIQAQFHMQQGAWAEAEARLRALQADYPRSQAVIALLDELALRAAVDLQWRDRIRGRRLGVKTERLLRRLLPFCLVLLFFLSGGLFYQHFISPYRQIQAQERAIQRLKEEGMRALQQGAYVQAMNLFDRVLEQWPQDATVLKLREDAKRQLTLATYYQLAQKVLAAGNYARALALFNAIEQEMPGYRDVGEKIQEINTYLEAEHLFTQADQAFRRQEWQRAAELFEEVRSLEGSYKADVTRERMAAAYLRAGQEIVSRRPAGLAELERARSYLQKVRNAPAEEAIARDELDLLNTYLAGERALRDQELRRAISAFHAVYQERPTYLGGYLVEQLYRSYVILAEQVLADGDAAYARELYALAASLPVDDGGEAARQAEQLATLVARSTPSTSSTPFASITALDGKNLQVYVGWIAFRSNRDGGADVYIMRADGSEQQRAPLAIQEQFLAQIQADRRSSDGRKEVVAQRPEGRNDSNIFLRTINPLTGDAREVMVTNFPGDEFEPVLSPAGDRIAFVSNHTGNDEIWTIGLDGQDPQQLTQNRWEWDKHPTWSPDGSQIAFFSNRSGRRQIWVMNADGTGQRNISNNDYEDWDPVWIK